jgi:CheY-like chemotaxis protein
VQFCTIASPPGGRILPKHETLAQGGAVDVRRVVLVVDDDPAFRDLVTDLLFIEGGLEVAIAEDGGSALSQMREIRPDLVLLDLKMPRVDGIEFCRHIRRDPSLAEIPVVAVTAWGPVESVRREALDAGCAGFLAKPFALDDLLAIVNRWLPDDGQRQVR